MGLIRHRARTDWRLASLILGPMRCALSDEKKAAAKPGAGVKLLGDWLLLRMQEKTLYGLEVGEVLAAGHALRSYAVGRNVLIDTSERGESYLGDDEAVTAYWWVPEADVVALVEGDLESLPLKPWDSEEPTS